MRPWEAERELEAPLAAAAIAARFPDLAGRACVRFAAGWDNTAFLVDGRWVFRFPRRAVAVPLLETEIRVLPALAPRLPLPIPVPERVGEPGELFPWPFAGYRLLPGRPALSTAATPAHGEALGGFLATLHALDLPGLGGDAFAKADLVGRLPGLIALAERLGVQQVVPVLQALAEAPPHPTTVPVHGDLDARHVLVDAAVSGVIDWGDVHRGDPALDLSIGWTWLDREARGALFAVYGPVDEATSMRARFRALTYGLVLLDQATAVGDAPLLRYARRILEVR